MCHSIVNGIDLNFLLLDHWTTFITIEVVLPSLTELLAQARKPLSPRSLKDFNHKIHLVLGHGTTFIKSSKQQPIFFHYSYRDVFDHSFDPVLDHWTAFITIDVVLLPLTPATSRSL